MCFLSQFSGKELIYGTMKIREHLVQNPPILDPLASISCCCFGHSWSKWARCSLSFLDVLKFFFQMLHCLFCLRRYVTFCSKSWFSLLVSKIDKYLMHMLMVRSRSPFLCKWDKIFPLAKCNIWLPALGKQDVKK